MICIPHSRANPIATTNPFSPKPIQKFISIELQTSNTIKLANKQNTPKHKNKQQTPDFWCP
jgi:hypothetical protein